MTLSQSQEITSDQMLLLKQADLDAGLSEIQIMDFAGLQLAQFVKQQYPKVIKPLLLIGPGGNGEHGLASARFLHLFGYQPLLLLSHPQEKLSDLAIHYLQIISALNLPLYNSSDQNSHLAMQEADIFLDALLGYGGGGEVRQPLVTLIHQVNENYKPTIAVDQPSGFSTYISNSDGICIKADQTLTSISPKQGFFDKNLAQYLGEIYLAESNSVDFFPKLG